MNDKDLAKRLVKIATELTADGDAKAFYKKKADILQGALQHAAAVADALDAAIELEKKAPGADEDEIEMLEGMFGEAREMIKATRDLRSAVLEMANMHG